MEQITWLQKDLELLRKQRQHWEEDRADVEAEDKRWGGAINPGKAGRGSTGRELVACYFFLIKL